MVYHSMSTFVPFGVAEGFYGRINVATGADVARGLEKFLCGVRMNVRTKLKALGLSDERIAELVGGIDCYQDEVITKESFPVPSATNATVATNTHRDEEVVLAWANSLAEGAVCYTGPLPIRFFENPLVPVRVSDPVGYVQRWLRTLAYAHTVARAGGFSKWDSGYWNKTIKRGVDALTAMHAAGTAYTV